MQTSGDTGEMSASVWASLKFWLLIGGEARREQVQEAGGKLLP